MNFIADKQTLNDLNISGKFKTNSIFNLFNRVRTAGGEKRLNSMFQLPLTQVDEINKRSRIIHFFQSINVVLPFSKGNFKVVENYISSGGPKYFLMSYFSALRLNFMKLIGLHQEYSHVSSGIIETIRLFVLFRDFSLKIQEENEQNPYSEDLDVVVSIFREKFGWLESWRKEDSLPIFYMAQFDYYFRQKFNGEIKVILDTIYAMDVFIAVSDTSREKGFAYATALNPIDNIIQIDGFYHPAIENPVKNSILLNQENNLLFLTGANMAGKSTLMKAFGISLYLAHMGFPVAAEHMIFSVRQGIFSSINVADNLHLGYSHFYAEVLRVKTVAMEVARGKNLIVLFDELFKGTNVKDAFDATLEVSEAFSKYRNCTFIISTHIIEVGKSLRERCPNVQFAYLPTVMEENIPKYTYRLKTGITGDRHGMLIIENEKILEILSSAPKTEMAKSD